ncbi:VOC family protein [Pseudomonas sp. SLFW]|uniref:VOC family protein n=1 Tax=Pseudomonas sp. SLFW TaxID=2683259 RepID=UPI001412CAC5|nr:VOC family protein [Pseudomonas sp. SLFW]NBB13094.1 glyoxalase [Pseudomonas sp. SLFW]
MAIIGIESLVYGVEDLSESTRFFEDFGLPLIHQDTDSSLFRLEEGSHVVLRLLGDPSLPASSVIGSGVLETIWGVDSRASLEALAQQLGRDRDLRFDADGTVHFQTDCGLAMALRVYSRKTVLTAPDALNSPGRINRLNQHRKWRLRARPKVIQHVVFAVQDYEKTFAFMKERLGFRLSDHQRTFGIYARADGANNHHNIFFLNANLPFGGNVGEVRFHHANFGVEDIDELMVGANYMERKGWEKSHFGLGRHRIDSGLFYYVPCPAGGEAEYGADADYVDDNWIPRDWEEPTFGFAHYVHNIPPFLKEEPGWVVKYLEGSVPTVKSK